MINEIIYWELYALVVSIFNGVLLAWIYDNIRAFRRIVRHKTVAFMSVEDIIYGIYAGLSVFVMCFKVADGIIRGFIIMGIAVGEKSVIPDGVQIGKNTAVSGVTSKEDYPDGVLESGETLIKAGGQA